MKQNKDTDKKEDVHDQEQDQKTSSVNKNHSQQDDSISTNEE